MTLTLAVETSSFSYDVALAGETGEILARQTIQLRDPAFRSIGYLVESMLTSSGYAFSAIDRLAVDVGPGNVISVRTGISYVNGLAFSLGRPVLSVDSLTLLAAQTAASGLFAASGAVFCVRNAGAGRVNAALFRQGERVAGSHGPFAEIVPELLRGVPEVVVAGTFRDRVQAAVPDVKIQDSGWEFPTVITLCQWDKHESVGRLGDFAIPVTDSTANSTSVHPL